MHRKIALGAALLLVIGLCGAAAAQQTGQTTDQGAGMGDGQHGAMHHQGQYPMFEKLDTNKDGKISWEEFKAAHPRATRQQFDKLDTDKSGAIEENEWAQMKEKFHNRAQERNRQKSVPSQPNQQ